MGSEKVVYCASDTRCHPSVKSGSEHPVYLAFPSENARLDLGQQQEQTASGSCSSPGVQQQQLVPRVAHSALPCLVKLPNSAGLPVPCWLHVRVTGRTFTFQMSPFFFRDRLFGGCTASLRCALQRVNE